MNIVPGAEAMRDRVERMARALQYRGPDDAGSWIDAERGIALGHQRLSIIDLSAEGHQPMASVSGRYVIAFNGEIYNFRELQKDLGTVPWRGHSDTEVMLAAIERWGLRGALSRFNGMFAFGLWDREERTLHLVRDRLGEKPLYYGWLGSTFVFGSELKALRAHPEWTGGVDRGALAAYLRHNYVPSPYSIYKNVSKLGPGHSLRVSLAAPHPQIECYWSMRDAAQAGAASPLKIGDEAAIAQLDELLRDAVKLRMVADVPVGVFLSGGIDSSAVVALMQAQSMRPVKTFSIGFEEESYNEARHAKAVAAHLGTEHTELYVTSQDAVDLIPSLPYIYDEPFADSSQIPTILVSRLARKDVAVTLSGDGGDELFCGYQRYFWGRKLWSRIGLLPHAMRNGVGAALKYLSIDTWNALIYMFAPLIPNTSAGPVTGDRMHKLADLLAVSSPDELYRGLMSHWSTPESVVIRSREAATAHTDATNYTALPEFTDRMMYMDAVTYLPDDILVKLDRASMSVGLEARVPLLDHRVVEYAWRVPLEKKIRGDDGKWLLRQVLHRYVPRELVERPKMGFGVPIDKWLRGRLRDWAEELLNEQRLKREGYFNPAPIRRKWAEHLSGARDWDFWLWDVLMFQAWLEGQRLSTSQG